MENIIWYYHYLIFSLEVDDFNSIDVASIDRVEPIEITFSVKIDVPLMLLKSYFDENHIKLEKLENIESVKEYPDKYWKDKPKFFKDDFLRCIVRQNGVVKKLAIRLGKNLTTNHV